MTESEKLILDELMCIVDDFIDFISGNVSFRNNENQRDRLEYLQNCIRNIRNKL